MGLEPTTITLATCAPTTANKRNDNELSTSEEDARSACAARSAEKPRTNRDPAPPPDPDLAAIVDSWPTLPEPLKAGILAMVRATQGSANDE